jgi:hypothetical protein
VTLREEALGSSIIFLTVGVRGANLIFNVAFMSLEVPSANWRLVPLSNFD